MLVGLIGSPFAGKSTTAAYLKTHHNFEVIELGNANHMRLFDEPVVKQDNQEENKDEST